MSRKDRTHLVAEDQEPQERVSFEAGRATKEEFGRRLYHLLLKKGWRQAELARRADLKRDSISNYVRGRTFPTPLSLKKLAAALGMTEAELLPNHQIAAIDSDSPQFEIRASEADSRMALLKIRKVVSFETAAKVAALINEDSVNRK